MRPLTLGTLILRLGVLFCCCLLLEIVSLAAGAKESPWSVTASALTPRTGPFPIRISVLVINYGRQPTPPGTLVLEMTPVIPYGTRPKTEGPHVWDPVHIEEEVPVLQPGESHNLVVPTAYFAATQQIDRRTSFQANNLGPTITTLTQVNFRAWVQATPREEP
ncbi:hypothetical protein JST97_09685 [bacterium]|nr:hypothetical protein [bacterium]